MIPKTIHYCWFGGKPKPKDVQENISAWRRIMPDYEIREWNEENFDVNFCEYSRQAYFANNFAFVSDVARLFALVTVGGIYFDTDVIVKKPFDSFLNEDAVMGFESDNAIASSVMACTPHHQFFESWLDSYRHRQLFTFPKWDMRPNVMLVSDMLFEKGLMPNDTQQNVAGVNVYPKIYFCAKDYETGIRYDTDATYTIHDFKGSWTVKYKTIGDKIKFRTYQLLVNLRYRLSK